ncbi:hypothetical protein Avbf_14088 [Armadillidium vulgare]|nr:hypothetical protein Avbf_14088 [Armadillidium vulgare]
MNDEAYTLYYVNHFSYKDHYNIKFHHFIFIINENRVGNCDFHFKLRKLYCVGNKKFWWEFLVQNYEVPTSKGSKHR